MSSFSANEDSRNRAQQKQNEVSRGPSTERRSDKPETTRPQTPITRVVKKLAPTQAGALKLARRYGAALVCVRHRHDMEGKVRFTTVELVVEQVSIGTRRQTVSERIVGIYVARTEYELKRRVRAHGAIWDNDTYTWLLPHRVARQLGLLSRVLKTAP